MEQEPEPQVPPPPPPIDRTQGLDQKQKDECMWAMLCHLSSLAGYVLTVPFAGVIGPLVVWLIKKDEYPRVDEQGKESMNFQISMAIYSLISILLVFVLIGFVLLIAVVVFDLVCVIIASVKAQQGESYKYPMCIRFIR